MIGTVKERVLIVLLKKSDIGFPKKTFFCPIKKSSKVVCLVVLYSNMRFFFGQVIRSDLTNGTYGPIAKSHKDLKNRGNCECLLKKTS